MDSPLIFNVLPSNINKHFITNEREGDFHNMIKAINNKNKSHIKFHTKFHTDTYTLMLDSNQNEYHSNIKQNIMDCGNYIDVIYDLILEAKFIPDKIILFCNHNQYTVYIDESDMIYNKSENKSENKFIKIPLKKYNINYININLFDEQVEIIIPSKYDGDIYLHYRYAILDNGERTNYGIEFDIHKNTDINIYDSDNKYFNLHNVLESDSNVFIIKNKIIRDLILECDVIPEIITINFGMINKLLTKEELLFYNNIYEDTITKFDIISDTNSYTKFKIKIPIIFNTDIILYGDIELKFTVKFTSNYRSKLYYTYKYVTKQLLESFTNEEKYFVINNIIHKKIHFNGFNNVIQFKEFKFPLKEIWFDGDYDEYISLNLSCGGKVNFYKKHLRKLNHLFGFNRIVNNYNLISFCIDNYKNISGELVSGCVNIDIEFNGDIKTSNDNIDIYGIGYDIIKYYYDNNKLYCFSPYNFC